ncbi:hypothetical protein J1605_010905 [Eschrichtius robustus]|uniref:Uncharacterized protein n=1 Tax=Eschrichtius robustus TaxID=9764 RepID=A0AB34GR32_ESCRO|nr:hypothetical protein J1605_010905 [Eschrichtius robustus]
MGGRGPPDEAPGGAGQPQPVFKAHRWVLLTGGSGLPAWPRWAGGGRSGWDAPALRLRSMCCIWCSPEGLHLAARAGEFPFLLALTPGGQEAAASSSKG